MTELAIAGRLEWTLVVECARNSKQCGCGYEDSPLSSSEVQSQFGPKEIGNSLRNSLLLWEISDAKIGQEELSEFVSS